MNRKKIKNHFAKMIRNNIKVDFVTSLKIANVFKKKGFPSLMSDDMADDIFTILKNKGLNPKKIKVMDIFTGDWNDNNDDVFIFPDVVVNGKRVSPNNDLPLWDGRP